MIVEQLKCAQELLKNKMKGFEMAYNSVKKIMGENAYDINGGQSLKPVHYGNRVIEAEGRTIDDSDEVSPEDAEILEMIGGNIMEK